MDAEAGAASAAVVVGKEVTEHPHLSVGSPCSACSACAEDFAYPCLYCYRMEAGSKGCLLHPWTWENVPQQRPMQSAQMARRPGREEAAKPPTRRRRVMMQRGAMKVWYHYREYVRALFEAVAVAAVAAAAVVVGLT